MLCRVGALQVASDSGLALVVVLGHSLVIMCQGMALSVAMNSKRSHSLVALMIAANFLEIKGTVIVGSFCPSAKN